MINVRVTQFETRAREARAAASLVDERRAARASRLTASRGRRITAWLPARPVSPLPGNCEG